MRKLFSALLGGLLLLGIVFLVLPGPGLLIIAAGLAILAREFFWAQRAMKQAKGLIARSGANPG